MNKFKRQQSGHNGTLNGKKEQARARKDRHDARTTENANKTPSERLVSLDKRGLVAKKERARLNRKGGGKTTN